MNTKIKNIVVCATMAVIVFGFLVLFLVLPKPEFLDSERREPSKLPAINMETIMKDGNEYANSFMKQFDDNYTPDNFPFREFFRNLKSWVGSNIFLQKDKDGVYVVDGIAGEMQETIDEGSIQHAADCITSVYDKYIKDKEGANVYISIIPDKGYWLSEENGYPSMDYDEFIEKVLSKVDFAEYINIKDSLAEGDFYASDTHWNQEHLLDVAKLLIEGMGGTYADNAYTKNTLDVPFYGVYAGRAPKPLPAETITYYTNENMANVTVFDAEKGRPGYIYDMERAHGKDAYDMFLGGEISKLVIENPNAKTDKELVVFRDSYGRSIIPLMIDDYAKITVIDTRYQIPNFLLPGVNFENADVLFLYSTLVLNASSEMKPAK